MKRKYAAIVLSMAMVLSPVSAFAADTTADTATTTEADATAEDEGTTEVSEYIIGQVTKVSDSSIEVKTGEVLKEESDEKTEKTDAQGDDDTASADATEAADDTESTADTESADATEAADDTESTADTESTDATADVEAGDTEVKEESESVSLQLADETQTYDIAEDTPLYSATGYNKLEVLAAGKEADDAAAEGEEKADEADTESTDETKADEADTESTDDTKADDATADDTDAPDVYEMVVGQDAVISTIKLSDIKEGDIVILKLDQDGKVESATVLAEAKAEAKDEAKADADDSAN